MFKISQDLDNLDHKNTYMIRKVFSSLLFEFNKAIKTKNIKQAKVILDLTKRAYDKIHPNILWKNKIKFMLNQMMRELNESIH